MNKCKKEKFQVINRTIDNYAGYWILDVNGNIKLHTDGQRETIVEKFSLDNLGNIISKIEQNPIWLAIKRRAI